MKSSKYTMGQCMGCRVTYRWEGMPLLRDAHCLHDDLPLRQVQARKRRECQDVEGDWLAKKSTQNEK